MAQDNNAMMIEVHVISFDGEFLRKALKQDKELQLEQKRAAWEKKYKRVA